MRIRAFVIAALLGAVAAVATGAPPPPADTIRLVDLTDEFDSFWERSRTVERTARVTAFKTQFARLIPGFYDPARLRMDDPSFYDRNLADALARYPEQRAGVHEVSRRFAELFAPARRSFEAEFGAFTRPETVYLLHSLGEMDGGTRSLPGGRVLIFGADVIARLHLTHRIQPFFHHELFHVRHGYSFRDCGEAVWCSLWGEGLATYVAFRLNPDATDAELLLDVPEPIRAAVEANRTEAVCAVLRRLDSTDGADRRALYSFNRLNERLPPRFGYYVGYLAAAELGRTRTLPQLAALPPAQVRPLLETALRSLATCPAAA